MLTPKVSCRVIGTCHPEHLSVPSAVDAGRQPKDASGLLVESSIPPVPHS
jgi:hypothetical protein